MLELLLDAPIEELAWLFILDPPDSVLVSSILLFFQMIAPLSESNESIDTSSESVSCPRLFERLRLELSAETLWFSSKEAAIAALS